MSLAVFQSIGPLELLIVLGIVLLIFGPKRLPGLGKQLGAGMREFKDSITSKPTTRTTTSTTGAAARPTAALGRPEDEPVCSRCPTGSSPSRARRRRRRTRCRAPCGRSGTRIA